jgi:RNA polymerase sigma-70 factor (ECF subfamily)
MADNLGEQSELESRLRHGDVEAAASLFSLHRERLWRMVNFRLDARLRARLDPDDVLQEGYLAAVRRIRHYGSDSPMSPFVWFRMIVLQTLIDLHRRHLGAQMRDAGREAAIHGRRYPQATSASLATQLVGDWTSPSQAAARAEMLSAIEQAIDGMDPVDREVLALRHFEEMTNGEVAQVLEIQQKAASIRYVRAVRRLRGILAEMPGFFDERQDA